MTKIDWKEEVKISDDFAQNCTKTLSEFESIWYCQLGRIEMAQHAMDVSPWGTQSIKSTILVEPSWCKPEENEIAKILKLEVVETDQSEWESPILSSSKIEWTLQFCIEHRKSTQASCEIPVPLIA